MDTKNNPLFITFNQIRPRLPQKALKCYNFRTMKNIFIAVFSVLALSACATRCAYWRAYSPDAMEEAKASGKAVLVLVTAPNCSTCESNWCRIFSRREFLEEVSEDCVPLFLNCPYEEPSQQCSAFRQMYEADLSPSLVLLESSGKKIATVPFPYEDADKCLESIRSLLKDERHPDN
jgi:thioredoxin-related protein